MKRILAWLLLAATMVSLCGCGSASEPAQTEAVPVETTVAETQATVVETQSPVLEDSLFLKASSVTFSLVGETDDIYLGPVPRDLVTWESEDPSVVSVDNGVLTANGVGTTTIRAVYGDHQLECAAGCLAETQEELESLGFDILSQPKRLPPEVDMESPCTYFDKAALVGDSISYMMMQWESKGNYLGDLLFFARGGTGMSGFVKRVKNIYYQGRETNLEDAIALSGVERAYFLIGSNDIASDTERDEFFDHWDTMRGWILEKSPDVEIVIISNIPQYAGEKDSQNGFFTQYNSRIAEYNAKIREYCQENGCMYLDLCYYIEDHCGRMAGIYNQDGYHMNEAGCMTWMKILRYYAQYELEGGTLT